MSFIPRLYIPSIRLAASLPNITLSQEHANYLLRVLRLKRGSNIWVFNEYGEFEAFIEEDKRNFCTLRIGKRVKKPITPNKKKLVLAFAPTKGLGSAFVVQKASELGADEIQPIITKRSVVKSVNIEKLKKIAIEAAEQSERISIPEVKPTLTLEQFLEEIKTENQNTQLIFCYERAEKDALNKLDPNSNTVVIVGPEGGFEEDEYALLSGYKKNNVVNVLVSKINNNILKAETASVAALAIVRYLLNQISSN